MKRYLLGYSLPLVLCALLAWALRPSGGWYIAPPSGLEIVVVITLIPLFAAWFATETWNLWRPRRLFCGRRRCSAALVATGVAAGVATLAVAGVGLVYLDEWVPDGWIFAATALAVSLLTITRLPRRRPGRCVYCAYDLRGATVANGGRCTECGCAQPA
jgi:hypothetical protein